MEQSHFLLTTTPHSLFFLPFFLAQNQRFWGTDLVDADLKNSRQLVFGLGQFPHLVQCVAMEESAPAGER